MTQMMKKMLLEPSRSRKKVIITRVDDMRTMQKMKRLMMMNLISERREDKIGLILNNSSEHTKHSYLYVTQLEFDRNRQYI